MSDYKYQHRVSNIIPSKEYLEHVLAVGKTTYRPDMNPWYDYHKPFGIWTSTLIDKNYSEWIEYVSINIPDRHDDTHTTFKLVVSDSAKVYNVSIDNVLEFAERYVDSSTEGILLTIGLPGESKYRYGYVNINKLKEDGYDGLHLMHRLPAYHDNYDISSLCRIFYSWDCESTVFWNWVFDSVEEIKEV